MKFKILLFAFLGQVTGCMKEPNLQPDFGPEVTTAEYQSVVQQLEFPSPLSIKKNEYAYFTNETYVEGRNFSLNKRWAFTVTNKVEDATGFDLTFVKELREYTEGNEKISNTSSTARIQKSLLASAVKIFELGPVSQTESSSIPKARALNLQAQDVQQRKTTFHNLKIEKGFFAVPPFVQQRANCGGRDPASCARPMKAFFVSFDQVTRDSGTGQKVHVDYVVSPEAPFFANTLLEDDFWPGILRSCVSSNIPVQGQRIRLAYCDEVRDFTFGN